MNTKSIIEIFRGDDSDALGYQTIVGTIHTDLDLAGCKAVFRYLGFFQEFDPIPEDGRLTIVIPSASSIQFPPGLGYASLKVYDIDRKVRTFTNRIPIFVSTKTPCRCGGEFDVEFSPFPELEPLKIFIGPNADDFDQYTGFVSKIIDRASLVKYGLAMLADSMSEDGGVSGKAASPLAVKAAYDAVIKELVDNYYTAEQTEEAIDRVAAYYITYTAAGAAFPTYAALANATTVYSGGKVRIPTRNDYCVVLADETHQGAEYRYIYAVAEGETTGSWQAQFPVEGVMTVDQTVQKNSQNPVSGGGVWSAIWGALSALPTGFMSLYDWVVSQLAGKASIADATLTAVYADEWAFTATLSDADKAALYAENAAAAENDYALTITDNDLYVGGYKVATLSPDELQKEIEHFNLSSTALQQVWNIGDTVATRISATAHVQVYQLGSQSTKPLATAAQGVKADAALPAADVVAPSTSASDSGRAADAKATGDALARKQSTLSAQQLANIAAVSDALSFDATHSYAAGDPVVYNGTLYTFTAAHTGAWTGSDVSAVDIIARLALKANDNAVVKLTGDQTIGGNKTFTGYDNFYDLTISHPQGQGYVRIYALANENRVRIDFSDAVSGSHGELFLPVLGGYGAVTLAAIENIAPDAFLMLYDGAAVDFNTLYCYQGRLYRCILGYTFQSGDSYPPDDPTHWALATVEDVLAALRTGKQDALSQTQLNNIAAVPNKANASDLRYTLPETMTTISSASSEVISGETVYYGAATLADRTQNQVLVLVALDELRVTIPPAVSGKVRDFGLLVGVGLGEGTALAAPALVPVAPTGETIAMMNAEGEMPTLADGTTTASGLTALYFTEIGTGAFLVKGEQIQGVA